MAGKLLDAVKSAPAGMSNASEPFAFECPITVFKADDAAEGKQRRVAGIISTDNEDAQREIILQDGLDFTDFINHGWFNDNHKDGMADVLGYPESVSSFKRGDVLPDGSKAPTNCTWVEGYLVGTKKADQVWELAQALQSTHRRLGYSVEGSIEKRTGPGDRTIAKAKIRHVALTHVPVNRDSRLEILARSLTAIACQEAAKAMSMGTGAPGPDVAVPDKPYTGAGAGRALAREDLDQDTYGPQQRKRRRRTKKSASPRQLTEAEALRIIKSAGTGISTQTARRVLAAAEIFAQLGIV